MKSVTYWHPLVYSSLLRLSYNKGYRKRYEAVSRLIEEGSSVTDVCCGDCRIFKFLKDKKVDYLGLDFNARFIKWAKRRGIKARVFDIYKDRIPKSDYILMMGSLCQFIPGHGEILEKLFSAARKHLIISEPVINYTHSKSRAVSLLSGLLSDPGDGAKPYRFNRSTFKEALNPYRRYIVTEFIANKECVVVIKKG